MQIREILVHLKSHEDWSPHLDYAIGTAKLCGARLRGLVTFAEASFLRSLGRVGDGSWGSHGGNDELEAQIEKDNEVAKKLATRLVGACEKAGVQCELEIGEGPASEIMPWAARLHDLTILEQRSPGQDELGYDPAEETALAAGRPVLLVPRSGRFTPCPDHILLAWNGSHQAASALHGALPFIERAKKVTICSGELRVPFRTSIRVPELSISSHIKAHGTEVEEEKVSASPSDVGDYLLDRANELGCGMIVMGAYGRSWFSEYILGGATRSVLLKMNVPILTGR